MPETKHSDDGLFLVQRNAHKDGTLFNNMFYLRRVELDGNPYVVGLQTALPEDALSSEGADVCRAHMQVCHKACLALDSNMGAVERVLSSMFWYMGPMRRQEDFGEVANWFEADDGRPEPTLLEIPTNRRGLFVRFRQRLPHFFRLSASRG